MTESEWLTSADPLAMIGFLGEERTHFRMRWLGWLSRPKFKLTERKWHLFYCACCRRVAHLLPVEASRQLIEVLESLADGKATAEDLKTAVMASMTACEADRSRHLNAGDGWSWAETEAVQAISRFHRPDGGGRSYALVSAARAWASETCQCLQSHPDWQAEEKAEQARQAVLLREVIGNPFQPAYRDETWLAWNDGTVKRLAHSIYEERSWEELPILADALEDAGCNDESLLSHFRGAGPHVLGCWALDLVLGAS